MFNWFKGIFSTPKVVDTGLGLIESGVKGIDALFFTEEEKAKQSQETYETWLEVQRVLANESTVRSITRRILAVSVMGTFLLFLIVAAFAWPFAKEWAAFLLSLSKSLSQLVLAVAVFYFGVHILRGWKEK